MASHEERDNLQSPHVPKPEQPKERLAPPGIRMVYGRMRMALSTKLIAMAVGGVVIREASRLVLAVPPTPIQSHVADGEEGELLGCRRDAVVTSEVQDQKLLLKRTRISRELQLN